MEVGELSSVEEWELDSSEECKPRKELYLRRLSLCIPTMLLENIFLEESHVKEATPGLKLTLRWPACSLLLHRIGVQMLQGEPWLVLAEHPDLERE